MNEMFGWLMDLPETVLEATSDTPSPFLMDCRDEPGSDSRSLLPFSTLVIDAPVIYEHVVDHSHKNEPTIEITGTQNGIKNLEIKVVNGCLEIKTRLAMKLSSPIIIQTRGPALSKVLASNFSRVLVSNIFCTSFEACCLDNACVTLNGTVSRLRQSVENSARLVTEHLNIAIRT